MVANPVLDSNRTRQDQPTDLLQQGEIRGEGSAALRDTVKRSIKELSERTHDRSKRGDALLGSEWEAKNEFATRPFGHGGVAGANPGALPTLKPTDMKGVSMPDNSNAREAFVPTDFGSSLGVPLPRLRPDTPRVRESPTTKTELPPMSVPKLLDR